MTLELTIDEVELISAALALKLFRAQKLYNDAGDRGQVQMMFHWHDEIQAVCAMQCKLAQSEDSIQLYPMEEA